MVFTYTPAALKPDGRTAAQFRGAGERRTARARRDRAETARALPPARHAGTGRHRARRDRHGAVGRAGTQSRHVAGPPAGRRREAGPGLRRRSATTGSTGSARVARGLGEARLHGRQGQDRLSDGAGRRRRHSRHAQGGRATTSRSWSTTTRASRRPRPCSGCACSTTKDSRGSRSPRLPTTTRATRWWRARRRRRSSAARTGGDRSTCSTPSTRRRPTS